MEKYPYTDYVLPEWFAAAFLDSGILGAFVVICVADLTVQLLAARSPISFLNIPGMFLPGIFWMCLGIEFSGISHVSWILVYSIEELLGWNRKSPIAIFLQIFLQFFQK